MCSSINITNTALLSDNLQVLLVQGSSNITRHFVIYIRTPEGLFIISTFIADFRAVDLQ